MRALSRYLLIFAAMSVFAAEEVPAPPPPQLPENLTLTNKKVLRRISVVRWEKERVVIRHLGGADPIMYRYIAEPQRAIMLALRDIEMAKTPPPRPGHGPEQNAAAPAGMIKYTGHCIVSSLGSLDTYKIAGANVLILPPEAEERFRLMSLKITLPRPFLQMTTDQDGKFEFSAPENQIFFMWSRVPGAWTARFNIITGA